MRFDTANVKLLKYVALIDHYFFSRLVPCHHFYCTYLLRAWGLGLEYLLKYNATFD